MHVTGRPLLLGLCLTTSYFLFVIFFFTLLLGLVKIAEKIEPTNFLTGLI